MDELTGHEKYIFCMGYLMHSIQMGKIEGRKPDPGVWSAISSSIEEKFTNHTIDDTSLYLEKINNFKPQQIINDIIDELEHEKVLEKKQ